MVDSIAPEIASIVLAPPARLRPSPFEVKKLPVTKEKPLGTLDEQMAEVKRDRNLMTKDLRPSTYADSRERCIIETSDRSLPSLSYCISFMGGQDFNPRSKVFLADLAPGSLTKDSLQALAGYKRTEAMIVGEIDDGVEHSIFMSGQGNNCGPEPLYPLLADEEQPKPLGPYDEPPKLARPIEGNIYKEGEPWAYELHSHVGGNGTSKRESDGYPSPPDLHGIYRRARNYLIVSDEGLTIYAPPEDPGGDMNEEQLRRMVDKQLAEAGMKQDDLGYLRESKKAACEILKVAVAIVPWEQSGQIEAILSSVRKGDKVNVADYLKPVSQV